MLAKLQVNEATDPGQLCSPILAIILRCSSRRSVMAKGCPFSRSVHHHPRQLQRFPSQANLPRHIPAHTDHFLSRTGSAEFHSTGPPIFGSHRQSLSKEESRERLSYPTPRVIARITSENILSAVFTNAAHSDGLIGRVLLRMLGCRRRMGMECLRGPDLQITIYRIAVVGRIFIRLNRCGLGPCLAFSDVC